MLTLTHESTMPNPRRGWATLTSFTLQAAGVTMVLLIPLLQPSLLPGVDRTPHMMPLFAPRVSAPGDTQPATAHSSSTPQTTTITVPREIPRTTATGPDNASPQEPEAPCVSCVGVGTPNGIPGGIPILSIAVAPPLPKPVAKPLRVSVMMDGYLIHRVQPDYPALARQARIQGPVELAAVISKQGTIENLQVLRGHPMLIPSALHAVKQWRYRPYILNGDPIEVNTRVTVTFLLGGN